MYDRRAGKGYDFDLYCTLESNSPGHTGDPRVSLEEINASILDMKEFDKAR
jgi:hypothetical protein